MPLGRGYSTGFQFFPTLTLPHAYSEGSVGTDWWLGTDSVSILSLDSSYKPHAAINRSLKVRLASPYPKTYVRFVLSPTIPQGLRPALCLVYFCISIS